VRTDRDWGNSLTGVTSNCAHVEVLSSSITIELLCVGIGVVSADSCADSGVRVISNIRARTLGDVGEAGVDACLFSDNCGVVVGSAHWLANCCRRVPVHRVATVASHSTESRKTIAAKAIVGIEIWVAIW